MQLVRQLFVSYLYLNMNTRMLSADSEICLLEFNKFDLGQWSRSLHGKNGKDISQDHVHGM